MLANAFKASLIEGRLYKITGWTGNRKLPGQLSSGWRERPNYDLIPGEEPLDLSSMFPDLSGTRPLVGSRVNGTGVIVDWARNDISEFESYLFTIRDSPSTTCVIRINGSIGRRLYKILEADNSIHIVLSFINFEARIGEYRINQQAGVAIM